MVQRTEKRQHPMTDTFQVNDEKITYMSLFDGLSCNQSFSQNKHKPKVKEKKSLDEV